MPAFWLLVPGALSLIGVTEVVGNPATASISDLVQPLASIISIALGVVVGVWTYDSAINAPTQRRPLTTTDQ